MSDLWREWLYPLGFLSALAFSSRMLLQWITSEAKGRSVVMPAFWKLSLCGNLLLATHSLIQVQFHVCLVQACNAVISWRNLNLMRPLNQQISFRSTILLLLSAVFAVLTIFWINGVFLTPESETWFRIPKTPWQSHGYLDISWSWHLIGFCGLLLFGSRFWVQWWCAEQRKTSYLGSTFWWISLFGEGLCLLYFFNIQDPVNAIGPAFGMIPYVRNLILIYRQKKVVSEGS
jgi:lipid-A-disaccharide synthase-like uncharacterized protein